MVFLNLNVQPLVADYADEVNGRSVETWLILKPMLVFVSQVTWWGIWLGGFWLWYLICSFNVICPGAIFKEIFSKASLPGSLNEAPLKKKKLICCFCLNHQISLVLSSFYKIRDLNSMILSHFMNPTVLGAQIFYSFSFSSLFSFLFFFLSTGNFRHVIQIFKLVKSIYFGINKCCPCICHAEF